MQFKDTHHYFPTLSAPHRLDEYAKFTPFRIEYICHGCRQINTVKYNIDICEYISPDLEYYLCPCSCRNKRIARKLAYVYAILFPRNILDIIYEIDDKNIYEPLSNLYDLQLSVNSRFSNRMFKTVYAYKCQYSDMSLFFNNLLPDVNLEYFYIANGGEVSLKNLAYMISEDPDYDPDNILIRGGIIFKDKIVAEYPYLQTPEITAIMTQNKAMLKDAMQPKQNTDTLLQILHKKPLLMRHIPRTNETEDIVGKKKKYIFNYFAKPYRFRK